MTKITIYIKGDHNKKPDESHPKKHSITEEMIPQMINMLNSGGIEDVKLVKKILQDSNYNLNYQRVIGGRSKRWILRGNVRLRIFRFFDK